MRGNYRKEDFYTRVFINLKACKCSVGDFSKIVLNFANKFFLEIVNNHVKREILEEYVKLKIIKNAIIFGYL